jgi:hypothetical protein
VTRLHRLRDVLRYSWWGRILAEHDSEPTELSGGLLKIVVGFWLILPLQTFSGGPAFGTISVIPEDIWALFLVIIGSGHLAALANGHPAWRRWAALVGCFVWCAMGSTFLWASPSSIGPLLFLGAGVSQAWCYVRLGYARPRTSDDYTRRA